MGKAGKKKRRLKLKDAAKLTNMLSGMVRPEVQNMVGKKKSMKKKKSKKAKQKKAKKLTEADKKLLELKRAADRESRRAKVWFELQEKINFNLEEYQQWRDAHQATKEFVKAVMYKQKQALKKEKEKALASIKEEEKEEIVEI